MDFSLESDRTYDLTVSWLVRGMPWGVSSCNFHAHLVGTGPLRPLGVILVARVTEICQGAASYTGFFGRSTLAAVRHDAINGQKVCTTLLIHAYCWYGPLGTLRGGGLRVGGSF